jgi:hypothetical protein
VYAVQQETDTGDVEASKNGAAESGAAASEGQAVALFGSVAEASGPPVVPDACAKLERNGISSEDIVGDISWRQIFDPELVRALPASPLLHILLQTRTPEAAHTPSVHHKQCLCPVSLLEARH